jgi:hypothetical protein
MKAFVNVPVAPVRIEPKDSSEMVTQFLFGEPIELLKASEQWRYCRSMVDQYEGWVDEKLIFDSDAVHVSTFLLHDPLTCIAINERKMYLPAGARIAGSPPSGRLGRNLENSTGKELVQTALQFLGAPYLWGGKTILGIDCSGLTQLTHALHAINLPRDASQQVLLGETVDFVELVASGDIAFFGQAAANITHVGFIMRADDFPEIIPEDSQQTLYIVHASGEVRIDAFDHQGIFRKDRNTYSHTLRVIKRMIP